ncbi:MAG: ABC transporter ATP-binding protein [bacterium]
MTNVIETQALTRRFGKNEAVHDLSIRVPAGSIFAFLGPNGAGKSTTIKLLMNILAPTAGSSSVLGVESSRLGPEQFQQIGYVAEDQRLPEWMTVEQFLNYVRPMYPTWDPAFCATLRKQFDLPPDRKLKQLSRGMRMKAALLASLAYRPKLLVLDEPFSGLDPLVRDEFIRGVLELTEQEQWTVFVSSHDIDEVERLADWVGIVNNGVLQLEESVNDLQARFRRMELVVQERMRLPTVLPSHWLVPEQAAHAVHYVDSQYEEQKSEAVAREVIPTCTQCSATPMSLREIFLALARTYRLASTEGTR